MLMVKLVSGMAIVVSGVGSVCKVWSGWVEAEKFVEDNLELIVG